MPIPFTAVMGGISLVSSLFGGRKQAKAQQAQAEAEAKIAEENARLVGLQIGDAKQRGFTERQDIAQGAQVAAGRQQASAGAANLDIGFGSPLDAVYESFANMERDFKRSDRNVASEVADLERQRTNYTAAAKGSRSSAKHARSAGILNTIATAASGASDIYSASIQP